ncbi:hypothetical protein QRX60_17055 [Amycolatopsis mongoliensis]|uniref:Uncharacterized protein n=1 Tax=Amycolatopsis mongoliensis TaxID=715475 RepID=A0A9Y2JWH7_9PSEU|nr:hypothetical protein [Amycolatopsis sp. 4-36]WIY05468.1 hypothetical protein QRX60_17055 [Amycolatopsis sp. 4-36]
MGNTARYGWAFPEVTDPPNTSLHLKNLAQAVESTVGGLDDTAGAASRPRGYVGGASNNVDQNVNTGEAIVISTTFTAVAGRRYKFTADFEYYQKSGTPATNMSQKIRVIAGGTATATGGTIVRGKYPNTGPALFITLPVTLVGDWVAPSSGTFAVSLTTKVDAGQGGIAGGGTDHTYEILVEDIGV